MRLPAMSVHFSITRRVYAETFSKTKRRIRKRTAKIRTMICSPCPLSWMLLQSVAFIATPGQWCHRSHGVDTSLLSAEGLIMNSDPNRVPAITTLMFANNNFIRLHLDFQSYFDMDEEKGRGNCDVIESPSFIGCVVQNEALFRWPIEGTICTVPVTTCNIEQSFC